MPTRGIVRRVSRGISFVYLTSSPFSGSTLFSFLVNSHPQVATVGEMTGLTESQDPEHYCCSCGRTIRECDFWTGVADSMASRNFSFDPGFFDTTIQLGHRPLAKRLLSGSLRSSRLEQVRDRLVELWPAQQERLRYLVERNRELAASILEVSGKSVFFDASKYPMAISRLNRDPEIDLRVVHLVRDVRGTSLSRRINRGETNWRRTVYAWARTNRNIERQLTQLPPDRWIRIRYEDLCRNPSVTLNRFFNFCGLAPHALPSNFSSLEHHIVGNRMRLKSPRQITLDERWRRELTPQEASVARQVAASLHARYGYSRMTLADLQR